MRRFNKFLILDAITLETAIVHMSDVFPNPTKMLLAMSSTVNYFTVWKNISFLQS